jgi:HEPN domain-containing protein
MTVLLSDWLAKAEADLGAAAILMRRRRQRFPDQVCFLCQQSTEKNLKAFLVANQVLFPKIHDLLQLSDLCASIDARFSALASDLAQLDLYAVEIRYPGSEATHEDASRALSIARRVRRFVERSLQDVSTPKLV